MESTPPTSKRIKTRAVRSEGRLESWFSGDNELIERYRFETSTKVINNPKVVSFDWLKSQKLDNVRELLKDQLLRRFLEMKGNIYPDLILVFYTNLKFEGNNLVSHVKGVDMEINHDVWAVVTGLKYAVPSRIRALTKSRSKSTSGVKVNVRRRLGEETPSASVAKRKRRQGKVLPR